MSWSSKTPRECTAPERKRFRGWLVDVLVGGIVGGVTGAIAAVNVVIFSGGRTRI